MLRINRSAVVAHLCGGKQAENGHIYYILQLLVSVVSCVIA